MKIERDARQRQSPTIPLARIEIDSIVFMRQGLRLHIEIHGPGVVPSIKFLEFPSPTAHSRRQNIDPCHRSPITAGADGSTTNKAKSSVVEIITVEIVVAHRRRTRANKTIDNVIVEQAHRPNVAVSKNIPADVTAAVRQARRKPPIFGFGKQKQPYVFKDEGAENYNPRLLLVTLPIRIEITDTSHLSRFGRIDPKHLGRCSQVEVASFECHRNCRIERCRFGVHVTAVKITTPAVNTCRPLRNAGII